jgi:hypothetical protein
MRRIARAGRPMAREPSLLISSYGQAAPPFGQVRWRMALSPGAPGLSVFDDAERGIGGSPKKMPRLVGVPGRVDGL